ncbi:hypothetical protein [Streptococcus pseudopneumoniae]|uniref:hypothetical protein n=1 Tax=Streptococcus pseudopneumoniae TaxID=257758 RepID=UPI00066C1253|nr:hypothetical protein [Streptococcus pseudopneumoniae]
MSVLKSYWYDWNTYYKSCMNYHRYSYINIPSWFRYYSYSEYKVGSGWYFYCYEVINYYSGDF